jgi:hypothetical protein
VTPSPSRVSGRRSGMASTLVWAVVDEDATTLTPTTPVHDVLAAPDEANALRLARATYGDQGLVEAETGVTLSNTPYTLTSQVA